MLRPTLTFPNSKTRLSSPPLAISWVNKILTTKKEREGKGKQGKGEGGAGGMGGEEGENKGRKEGEKGRGKKEGREAV